MQMLFLAMQSTLGKFVGSEPIKVRRLQDFNYWVVPAFLCFILDLIFLCVDRYQKKSNFIDCLAAFTLLILCSSPIFVHSGLRSDINRVIGLVLLVLSQVVFFSGYSLGFVNDNSKKGYVFSIGTVVFLAYGIICQLFLMFSLSYFTGDLVVPIWKEE